MFKRNSKTLFLINLAYGLWSARNTITILMLTNLLKKAGFHPKYGGLYKGGRGTYTLVASIQKRLHNHGLDQDAENVAHAFVKPNGEQAWK